MLRNIKALDDADSDGFIFSDSIKWYFWLMVSPKLIHTLYLILNKLIQKDYTSLIGILFVLVSIHRIIFKKERNQ